MTGSYHLTVQSAHLKYELELKRNISVIQGQSASGKTTLVDMIREYDLNGADTGITLQCDVPCKVLEGTGWKEQLAQYRSSLIFIDEGNRFVSSSEFAAQIRETDNYYIIVSRESLDNLPYSVSEIYGIRSSGKYHDAKPVYHELYHIYHQDFKASEFQTIITEDSNAGYEFFKDYATLLGRNCISASGAGNIFPVLNEMNADEKILIIADGAAFGPQMKRVHRLMHDRSGTVLYLPESFEWLILSADVLNEPEIRNILDDPSDYIDSSKYFSWERYFTDLLVTKSQGSYLEYSKKKLNPAYLMGKVKEKLIHLLPW